MSLQLTSNFQIHEFVPKETYAKWGDQKSTWFIDPLIVQIAQALRDEFGPMVINGLLNGHQYNYSGYRPPDCKEGGKESQHRFGRGIDSKFKNFTVQEVYKKILENENLWLKRGLTTLEDISHTPTWLHCDCRWTGMDKILIVKPK